VFCIGLRLWSSWLYRSSGMYVWIEDGRILKFTAENDFTEFVNTQGRPLGMQFDANNNLIVEAVRPVVHYSVQCRTQLQTFTRRVAADAEYPLDVSPNVSNHQSAKPTEFFTKKSSLMSMNQKHIAQYMISLR